ncbi:Integrase [Pseudodesulfovibrio profundus]|uniref:Integrase n=1 Tax=Pseudodesulfovibrio profundus TaxID=57320 RepID=A0A2C8FCK5_9BACT|nr:site-specific integrase [Pseudodesulfovibrio profundus]SOB60267.1 Integrase [Pseudodesulfovibrio profundus]
MATVTIATRSLKKGKAYVIHVKDPETGKKEYHKTYRRKDLAQAEVNRIRTLIDSGIMPTKEAKNRKQQSLPTFGQGANLCQDEWDRKLGEGKIGAESHSGYGYLLAPILKEWKHTLLHDLDEDTIRDYRIGIAEKTKAKLVAKGEKGKNCNVLANRRLFVIKQVFAQAKRNGLIDKDVAKPIPYLSEKDSERKTAQKPIEVDALLEAAAQRRAKHYMVLAILLAVEHGCSTQEVLMLKRSDIDLDENRITFHRTKNGVTRSHQIMPRTRDALIARLEHLSQYRKKRGVKAKGEYVIGHMDGTPFKSIDTAWSNMCTKHGFNDLHFHDHRHTYCTNMLLSGSTLKETNVMIGHKTLRMTDRYSHLEGVIDSSPQDRLAQRYAMTGTDNGPSEAADT